MKEGTVKVSTTVQQLNNIQHQDTNFPGMDPYLDTNLNVAEPGTLDTCLARNDTLKQQDCQIFFVQADELLQERAIQKPMFQYRIIVRGFSFTFVYS